MNKPVNVQNPFITGQPARGSDFVGRVRLLNRVKQFVKKKGSQNFVIVGKRRSGKTSLLKKIQDTYSSDAIIVLYFNMQKYTDSSLESVLDDIKNRLKPYAEFPKKGHKAESFEEFLCEAFEYPLRKVLFLFDEFDVMCGRERTDKAGTATAEFADFWNTLCKFTKNRHIPLKSIFASSHFFLRSESPCCNRLFKSGSGAFLSPLNKNAVYRILGMGDLQFRNQNVLDEFYKLTAGNPFFTQVLAYTLFETETVQQGQKIGLQLLWRAMRKALKSYGYGAAVIWGELPSEEQKILYYISRLARKNIKANLTAVEKALKAGKFSLSKRLIQKHLSKLKKEKFLQADRDKNYWFASNFFREWVLRSVKKSDLERSLHS